MLYLYDNSDPVYSDNFRFFLQEGVAAHDGCQYIIVVPDALLKGKVSILAGQAPQPCNITLQCCDMLSQKGPGTGWRGGLRGCWQGARV